MSRGQNRPLDLKEKPRAEVFCDLYGAGSYVENIWL